ncbi:MAG: GAF domain-containing protein [Anaerolineae bacterium]|nr:GAF domain-containing protein [Anaerolineae bacterium]
MSILQEMLNLVLAPPGDLYYHLAILFTLQILLALAWGDWRRRRGTADIVARRTLWMAWGMLLTRVILVAASAISGSGAVPSAALIPPLERFLDFCLIPLAMWGFLPLLHKYRRAGSGITAGILLVASLAYAIFAATWPSFEAAGYYYNHSMQPVAWQTSAVVLAALGLLALLLWPRPRLELAAAALLAWLGGHLAELLIQIMGLSPAPHLAAAVRLSNLVAIPLLTGAAFHSALQRDPAPLQPPHAANISGLLSFVHQLEQGTMQGFTGLLPHAAQQLEADALVVGLLDRESKDNLRIAATYPPIEPPLPALPLQSQTILADAARSQEIQQAAAPLPHRETNALLRRLGITRPGPTLAIPLIDREQVVGLLLPLRSRDKAPFSPAARADASLIADVIALALALEQYRAQVEQSAEALGATIREHEAELKQKASELEKDLKQARQESQLFARQATEAERQKNQQQKRADELAELVRIREEQIREASSGAAQMLVYEKELHNMAQVQAALQAQVEQWRERAGALEREKDLLAQNLPADVSPQEQGGDIVEAVTALARKLHPPIDSIAADVDRLLDESSELPGEQQRRSLQRARLNIERLRGTLDDMVESARVGSQQTSLVLDSVAIPDVVKTATNQLASELEARNLAVRTEISPTLPAVKADRTKLYQIVYQLLANACRSSRPGSEITVSAQPHEVEEQDLPPQVVIAVAYAGEGAAAEDLAHVFEPLPPEDAASPPEAIEARARMAQVKTLVEAHGGWIWVESEPGKGSTLRLTLPASSTAGEEP